MDQMQAAMDKRDKIDQKEDLSSFWALRSPHPCIEAIATLASQSHPDNSYCRPNSRLPTGIAIWSANACASKSEESPLGHPMPPKGSPLHDVGRGDVVRSRELTASQPHQDTPVALDPQPMLGTDAESGPANPLQNRIFWCKPILGGVFAYNPKISQGLTPFEQTLHQFQQNIQAMSRKSRSPQS